MFLYNATKSQVHNDWRGWHCAVDECRLFDKWVQRWNSRFHRETFHCFKHRFHFSYLYVISLPLSAAQWRPTTAQAWVAHRQAVPHIFCTASLWPHSSLHQTGSPSSACRLQICHLCRTTSPLFFSLCPFVKVGQYFTEDSHLCSCDPYCPTWCAKLWALFNRCTSFSSEKSVNERLTWEGDVHVVSTHRAPEIQ